MWVFLLFFFLNPVYSVSRSLDEELHTYLSKFGSGFNLLHSPVRHQVIKHLT